MKNDLRPRKKGFLSFWFAPCFDNIASQIKALCHILYWVSLIGSMLAGLVIIISGIVNQAMPYSLLYALCGVMVILLSPLWVKLICFTLYGLYGFADMLEDCNSMAEDTKAIRRMLRDMDTTSPTPPASYNHPYAAPVQPQPDAYAYEPQAQARPDETYPGTEYTYSRRRASRSDS